MQAIDALVDGLTTKLQTKARANMLRQDREKELQYGVVWKQ